MNSRDLRKGNLIHDDHGRVVVVKSIGVYETVRVSPIDNSWMESKGLSVCSPIPITEEWLLKFGFKKSFGFGSGGNFYVYEKGEITYNTNHGFWWGNRKLPSQPRHVHQLQNLYLDLTGTELQTL